LLFVVRLAIFKGQGFWSWQLPGQLCMGTASMGNKRGLGNSFFTYGGSLRGEGVTRALLAILAIWHPDFEALFRF
jgi:hypothetical protein